MNLTMQDWLWDILETEACIRFFINQAKKPAFLILHKCNPLSHGSYEVYMNHLSIIAKCKTEKKALERVDDMLRTATQKIDVYIQKKRGLQYGEKKLYVTVDPDKPCRVKLEA